MKQVILVRKDLKMPSGKLAAQVSHASVSAVLKSSKDNIEAWEKNGMKKVVLKVNDEKELLQYERLAKKHKLTAALIKDLGKTFFDKPTITCLCIGPEKEDLIDKVTGKLKML